MADQLTAQQNQAVHNRGGKLLVSAAAGSGKTRVLVERLLDYLTDPVDPANMDEFLMITYTNAAAMELRGKIAAKLTERIAQEPENKHLQQQLQRLFLTQISTVHGFCASILKEYAYQIDLPPDFRVADGTECEELRQQVMKDLLERAYEVPEEESHFHCFVDSQGVGRNDGSIQDVVLQVYDSAQCHRDPEQWLSNCLEQVELEGITDGAQSTWGKYLMDDLFHWLDIQIAALEECCSRLEKDNGVDKPLANFTQIVQQLKYLRASTTWDEVCSRKDISFGTLRFSGKEYDSILAERVKAVREDCKKELPKYTRCFANGSDQVLTDLRTSAEAARGLIWLVQQFGADYARVKRSRRILDFSDLEHDTLKLLWGKSRSTPTAAAREIAERFREIMVDEYQDSNEVQDEIFSALTQQRKNCFMVGDVKQSIYRFRLADPQIFLEKYNSYVPAAEAQSGQGRKILLSDNFRSGIEVISGINDVFSTCMSQRVGGLIYGAEELLREGVPHTPLGDEATELYVLDICDGDSYRKEAAFTAKRIKSMLEEGTKVREGEVLRPVTAEDIVILLRSPGTMGEPFLRALEAEGIRCTMDGASNLMETAEVGTLCALLQVVDNPRQDIPLLAVLASPVFGFTADDLASFRAAHKKGNIFDALCESDQPKAVRFVETLRILRKKARLESLTQLLESCFILTRLDSVYGALPGGKGRKANLQAFFQLAVDYEKSSLRTLSQFLEHLQSLNGNQVPSTTSSAGCVRLMSIHKSKGLEFPVVFLCGLSHGFNLSDRYDQVLCHKELGLGLAVADNVNRLRYSAISKQAISASIKKETVSEELRVLYVAMTRAKDRLIMTSTLKNPEKKLANIANRLFFNGAELLSMEANCYGDWILMTAMQRMEAGELHVLAGRPEELHISDYPWKIKLVEDFALSSEEKLVTEDAQLFPQESISYIREGLAFRYAHTAATRAPSKQTATGRKGRIRDEEARENTRTYLPEHTWRKPTFRQRSVDGTTYGNAVHSVMQFIRYEECGSEAAVAQEIARMVSIGQVKPETGAMVAPGQIAAFFATDIGKKLRSGAPHIREFKFSILDDGEKYGEGLEGEQVLLQGVVDCALLEEDGITVLDFKTDRVTEQTLPQAVERYRIQLETYADALSRIYEKQVKQKLLYFFHLGRFVQT